MTKTHISQAVSKRLKEFLGDSAPEPMGKWSDGWHCFSCGCQKKCEDMDMDGEYGCTKYGATPKYQLHDLLKYQFCEVMSIKIKSKIPGEISKDIWEAYWLGGLPAVEKCLLEMMEAK